MDALLPDDPDRIGPYRLEGRLGAGGMGEVFLARSPGGRVVVVKRIHGHHAGDPEYRTRFAREIDAASRVGGHHTAQVVAADPGADRPWMVTAHIPGPSLQALVSGRGPLTADAVATLGAGLAEGLGAIHERGLVHRDLKPGNVICADDGPRIIDFGIARPLDASTLTETGAVVGTCAYMSPEQLNGHPATPAADVFALGCVLAFAATGQSPFHAPSLPAVVHRVTTAAPDLTRVPTTHDLRALIAACLAKHPADRPTPADILTWFASAHPLGQTLATPPGDGIAGLSSGKRGGMSDGGLGGAPSGLSAGLSGGERGGLPGFARGGERGGRADASVVRGITRRVLLTGGLGVGAVLAGVGVFHALDLGGAASDTPAPEATKTPVMVGHAATLTREGGVFALAFSPDGTLLATGGSGDPLVELWNVATGERMAALKGHTMGVNAVAFHPQGTLLVTAGGDKTAMVWDVVGRVRVGVLKNPDMVTSVAFSPDGTLLAAACGEKGVPVWDMSGRTLKDTFDGHAGGATSVAFSHDGTLLASGGSSPSALLWDLPEGARPLSLLTTASVYGVAFNPGGTLLATVGGELPVRLWDVAARREAAVLPGHTDSVSAVAFSPDGTLLATSGADRTVRLWDVAGRSLVDVLTGFGDRVGTVAFNHDGTLLAAGSFDRTVRLWKIM